MAFLIPENIASRSDIPATLQGVARAFRDLVPEDVTVWLDRQGDGQEGEPYLTVLDPTVGIALVYAPKITARDAGGGLFRRRGVSADLPKAVLERARAVETKLGAESRLPDTLPAAAVIAAPALDTRSLERLGLQRETTLIEDDFTPDTLRPAIARALAAKVADPLTELQERVVRGLLKPEIVISGAVEDDDPSQLVFRPPDGDEDAIRVLDRQQERLAHHLGEGYRVIRGVAGSGKTLVLTFRAKWYAENFPQKSVLLTCFNVPLQKALEAQLNGMPSVTVRTIDGIAYDARGRRGSLSGSDEWTRARLDAAAKLRSSGGRYDVVLVDEGQDLDTAGLELAYAALKRNRDDFIVALDGAQNVYRKSARWNPPGQTARGRSTVLRLNYRNTKEILEFAHRFLGAGSEMPPESALDDPTAIVPPEATSRRGPKPKVILCRDATDEVTKILDGVEEAREAGAAWGDIAILYGSQNPWQFKIYGEAQARGIPYFWVSRNGQTKRQVIEAGDVVRCATYQGLKGLEFSRVFMCGVNDIYDPGGTDDDTIRKIAYVAMTRAMDELTITVAGTGPIGAAIQAASR